MRTLVDLPEDQIKALDQYRAKRRISRAEAVRRAIAAFLPSNNTSKTDWAKHPAFASSRKSRRKNPSEFVRRIRSEWERKR